MGFLSDRKEKKEQARAAEERYGAAARRIATGDPSEVTAGMEQLRTETFEIVPLQTRAKLAWPAISAYADGALADDVLSEEEGTLFVDAATALGIDPDTLNVTNPALLARLAIARVNDGRLPEIEQPVRIIPKAGEVVHLQTLAGLLKEVAIRQWQGGYGGVGFRVAKGVTFRTGQVKGRSVVVGSEIKIDDTGILSVTSSRVVFLGDRKTVDIPFTKLVGLNVFSDGVTLQSSSRQNAVPLRVDEGYGEVVAATINAAMQRVL
jgi:hypothetical protein